MFHSSVAEMLARVSARELAEWDAFYRLRAEDEQRERGEAR